MRYSEYSNIASATTLLVNKEDLALWIDKNEKIEGTGSESNAALIIQTDDGPFSDYTVFYNYLYGIYGKKGCSYLCTKEMTLTQEQIIEMKAAGWDFLMHSDQHTTDMSGWSDTQLRTDIESSHAVIESLGLDVPIHWVAPAYNSYYPNVRRVSSEYYKGHRQSVYMPFNTWDNISRMTTGVFLMWLNEDDDSLVNAKKLLDTAIANNYILIIVGHRFDSTVTDPSREVRFKDFVDYAITTNIEIITYSELYSRMEAHQGYYIDQAQRPRLISGLITNVFEQSSLGNYEGHLIFNIDLLTVGEAKIDELVALGYKVAFLNDTSDAAFAYAVPNTQVRAVLVAAGVTNLKQLLDYPGAANNYHTKSINGDINDIGLCYHISARRVNFASNSNLTGEIPQDVANMKRCYEFIGSSTGISGTIPIEISKMVDLEIFKFNDTNINNYETGAFGNHMAALNDINLESCKLNQTAINNILIEVRNIVKIHKHYVGNFGYTITPVYNLLLGGRFNQAPTGDAGDPDTGLGAKYQLENAISELGATADWTITANSLTPSTTPANYNGLCFWLDAALGITKSETDKVSGWKDLSTSFNHVVQVTVTNNPTWVDSQINSLPIIRCSNSQLNTSTTGFTFSPTGCCMFLVYKQTTIDTQFRSPINHTSDYTKNFIIIRDTGGGLLNMTGATATWGSFSFAFATDTFYIFEISASAGTVKIYLNGTLKSTTDEVSNSFLLNRVCGRANLNGFAGDIAEIICYSQARSDAERAVVRGYLQTKYNL